MEEALDIARHHQYSKIEERSIEVITIEDSDEEDISQWIEDSDEEDESQWINIISSS